MMNVNNKKFATKNKTFDDNPMVDTDTIACLSTKVG